MANLETQILDDIIVKSRRKMLALGVASFAGLMLGGTEVAHAATYSDSDILNFALNLEFLEANFYYLAAFGCTINTPNAAALAAGAPTAGIPITGSVGTAGTVTTTNAGLVPFTKNSAGLYNAAGSYAVETAIEEGHHVLFLQSALGSAAVAQPAINLGSTAWAALASAANTLTPAGAIPSAFSPYASDADFLIGAYVFEDVGVTAYHGAASLLTVSANLSAAAGILSVEAYHAGLVRTTINATDTTGALTGYTNSISALRAALAKAAAVAGGTSSGSSNTYDPVPDDYGLVTEQVTLGSASSTATASHIVDCGLGTLAADPASAICTARTTTQVLNIVTGGGAVGTSGAVTSPAKGVFFPSGMNAGPNGFS